MTLLANSRTYLAAALTMCSAGVDAGEVAIKFVEFERQGLTWRVEVTVEHADTGWEHYANAWRIVNEQGDVFAERILHHPHVDEQPFARSQTGITIPAAERQLIIEARDNVHGWSADRVRVDLQQATGERYRIR